MVKELLVRVKQNLEHFKFEITAYSHDKLRNSTKSLVFQIIALVGSLPILIS